METSNGTSLVYFGFIIELTRPSRIDFKPILFLRPVLIRLNFGYGTYRLLRSDECSRSVVCVWSEIEIETVETPSTNFVR